MFITLDTDDGLKMERLYALHKNRLFGVAYSILHDKPLAEDAVHDTFLRIADHLHKIDESNSYKTITFLLIICKNAAIDIYNNNKKVSNIEVSVDAFDFINTNDENNPLNILITNESIRTLINSVKQLKSIYRDVLLLKYNSFLSNEEIAQLLRISQVTVRKRLERGKKLLIKVIEKDGIL